jgi:MFS family permease
MALSASLLGLYFHLNNPHLGWLALSAVVGYFAAFSLGVGPIPWILASELFPASSRGTANSIATITMFVGAAVTTKLLPDMKGWLGLDGLFWFYAVCCLGCAVFTMVFVPETKGKSADDILRAI